MQNLEQFKNEMNLQGKNVHVGQRYKPKMFGEWDNTKLYEPLSIVQYQGASYTSRQYVPVGVEIINEEYWALTGNYNAQVEVYRGEVRDMQQQVTQQIDNEMVSVNETITQQNTTITEQNNSIAELSRGNAKLYPKYIDMVNDTQLKKGDYAQIASYKYKNDGVEMTFEIMGKTDEPYITSGRLQKISAQLVNGLVAVPYIEKHTPKIINDEILTNELLRTAHTYFENADKLVYDIHRAHDVMRLDRDPVSKDGLLGPSVCSSLVNLSLMGVEYKDSRYVAGNALNKKTYPWGNTWLYDHIERYEGYNANELAMAMYKQGMFYTPNDDLSNIRRGDILFFSEKPEERGNKAEDYNFLHIFHNAVYNGFGQIIQSSATTHGAVTIDDITQPVWSWLREQLIGFVRLPLGPVSKYNKRKNIATTNADVVISYNPQISVSENFVRIDFPATGLKSGLTVGTHVIGTIEEKYRPEETQFFFIGTSLPRMYRCSVSTSGEISILVNNGVVGTGEQLYGYVTYPLKNVTPTYPTY